MMLRISFRTGSEASFAAADDDLSGEVYRACDPVSQVYKEAQLASKT